MKRKKLSVNISNSDCLTALKSLDTNSIDSIVTDPPAGISFMGKEWDANKGGRRQWIDWLTQVMEECLRVLKPGGHALVWALPRTSHWTATAIEDAGFEVRDCMYHVFGSGFPKSLDVSKAIDKAAGAEREVVGTKLGLPGYTTSKSEESGCYGNGLNNSPEKALITAPATDAAKQWSGWGTALKPAVECWWLCRKPLSEKTVAANVLKWGTGALNIDECRVAYNGERPSGWFDEAERKNAGFKLTPGSSSKITSTPGNGRFPANLIHDGSEEVIVGFPNESSRFFYCPKASKKDRGPNNKHPTVKHTELMRYLCRLITPSGGKILDPFSGSGSTGVAAIREGFSFIGIEKDTDSYKTTKHRLNAELKKANR